MLQEKRIGVKLLEILPLNQHLIGVLRVNGNQLPAPQPQGDIQLAPEPDLLGLQLQVLHHILDLLPVKSVDAAPLQHPPPLLLVNLTAVLHLPPNGGGNLHNAKKIDLPRICVEHARRIIAQVSESARGANSVADGHLRSLARDLLNNMVHSEKRKNSYGSLFDLALIAIANFNTQSWIAKPLAEAVTEGKQESKKRMSRNQATVNELIGYIPRMSLEKIHRLIKEIAEKKTINEVASAMRIDVEVCV